MTRGTDTNMAFVFTTPARPADPRPGTQPARELNRYDRIRHERQGFLSAQAGAPGRGRTDPREPIAVLADVLDRDGAALSASATRQRNLANADHLGILQTIWSAETAATRNDRYRELVLAALPPGYRQDLSPRPGGCSADHAGSRVGRDGPGRGNPTAIASRDQSRGAGYRRRPGCRIWRRVAPLLPGCRAPGPAPSPTCQTPTAEPIWTRSRP